MVEGDRAGVVADGAQARRELAERCGPASASPARPGRAPARRDHARSPATAASASSGATQPATHDAERRSTHELSGQVDQARDERAAPSEAGGSSSATASPVTSWSIGAAAPLRRRHRSVGVIAASLGRSPVAASVRRTLARMDLDAYVRAHQATWERLDQPEPAPPAHRGRGRRAGRPLPGGRDPPQRDPLARPGPRGGGLPQRAARPGAHPRRRAPGRRPGAASPTSSCAASRPRSTAPGAGG